MDSAKAARQGQESLYSFLLAWQEGLNVLSSSRIDPTSAAEQLEKIKVKYTKHLEELELAASILDKADHRVQTAQVCLNTLVYKTFNIVLVRGVYSLFAGTFS